MTSICRNIAELATRWVERNSPYLIDRMANLSYSLVRAGCDMTRKAAIIADDMINTALGRFKTRF